MGSITNLKREANELRDKFKSFWPELLADISSDQDLQSIPYALEWLETVMKKNVPQGKQNRGLIIVGIFNRLVRDRCGSCPPEELKLALIAGWIAEIGQASAIMADDIMDSSETRRGEKCWYKLSHVGLSAVNDCLMLENITYFIMYKYFSENAYFPRFLRHNHDTVLKTIFGQCMDTRTALDFNLDNCKLETYKQIVMYKTSYYSFYSPIATGMILAGVEDDALFKVVKEVTLPMGYLFQAQDDYLDCFGDPKITGKIGSDILDGKCTWLLVKALELASESQRKVLKDCYGKKDGGEAEECVKQVYIDLGLKRVYHSFEDESYTLITQLINALPQEIPMDPFFDSLNLIYKRKK